MKTAAKYLIRRLVAGAPWGVREALLDGYIARHGTMGLHARFLSPLNVVELAAAGDRGIVTSLITDTMVLPEYGSTGTFAPLITKALVEFFSETGGTYFDIGANIGLMTIPIARNQLVKCYAFEPEPNNFDLLRRNVLRNASGGGVVEFHQAALFDRPTTLSLALANGNIGDHRVTTSSVKGRKSVEVPALPLDYFFDGISGRLAIKIDTQGAEPFVIAGGRKTFSRAGLLAMEFCPFLIRQLGGDPLIPIEIVSEFRRVAVMSGGIAEIPRFVAPGVAQDILRSKLRNAKDTDGDYVDILAFRDP